MKSLEKVASFFTNVLLQMCYYTGSRETLLICLTCLEDNNASDSGSVVSRGVEGCREGQAGLRAAATSLERFLLHCLAAISPEI